MRKLIFLSAVWVFSGYANVDAQQSVCPASKIAAPACGTSLATYPPITGQTAFSNGLNQGTGCSCAGGPFYQCVEYVKRFYSLALGVDTSGWTGNADQYFTTAAAKGLVRFSNPNAIPPAPNDILVFEGDSFGHVAIVTQVTQAQVEIIEQNWSPSGTANLPLTFVGGLYSVQSRGTYKILGWLRLPASQVISVTGPNDRAGGLNVGQEALAVSWTQSSAHTNVTISANIMGVTAQTATAYLTTQLGSATTMANEIARTTVTFPGFNNFTNVVLLNVPNLPAGTYYLTVIANGDSSCTAQTNCSPGAWAGTSAPLVTVAPGVTLNGSFYTPSNPGPGIAAYPPASTFSLDTFQGFLFTVTGQ